MPGLGIGISPLLKKASIGGPTFPITSAFVSTVVDRGGVVTAAEQEYLSIFETSMGSNLAEFDRLWIHGLSNNIAARTSFVNPSSTIVSAVNAPTFLPNVGYQGDGSTSYLNSNFNPATQGVKYTLNSGSYGIYSLTNRQVIGSDIGSFDGTAFILLQSRRESDSFNVALNDVTFSSASNIDSRGLFIGSAISGNKKVIKNGITLDTSIYIPVQIPSVPLYICGWSSSGAPQLASTRQYALSFVGSGAINQTTFYNSIQTLGTSLGWFSYTTNFKAVVIARGGSLTSAEESYLRTFETSMGADLAEFDRLYIHGLSNEIAAKTSFVNPTSTMITAVNSPTFTPNQGYQGNGSTSYLNSNFTPSTQGVKYTQNSASIFAYSRTNNTGNYVDVGVVGASNKTFLYARYNDGNSYYPVNLSTGVGSPSSPVANSRGFYVSNLNSTTLSSNKNGVQLVSITVSPVAVPTEPFYLLAYNSGGTAEARSINQLSVSGMGSGAVNQTTFYNAVQALGTSIGWAV